MSENQRSLRADALARTELLETGAIRVLGRMPNSSNATFLVEVTNNDASVLAVYKPRRGERPLWDFPDGLCRREVAAYELSEALELHLIPPTVLRHDAPFEEGSLQLFIEADFAEHYFTLEEREDLAPRFVELAVFDIVANNSDRKSGHVLIDAHNQIWGIDNGLCFHDEPKLRTVIWEFGGCDIPLQLRNRLSELAAHPPERLGLLLSEEETEQTRARASALAQLGVLPEIDPDERWYP
ncbi:MAG: SCO1664 family protein, partial [Acidimicrobiales bacterium]